METRRSFLKKLGVIAAVAAVPFVFVAKKRNLIQKGDIFTVDGVYPTSPGSGTKLAQLRTFTIQAEG